MGSRLAVLLVLCLGVLGGPRPVGCEEEFAFYGLRFGMPRAEIQKLMPLVEAQKGVASVTRPGHGMVALSLVFDREDLLMEIHASYPRPEEPLELEGVRRALRERFVTPITAAARDVTVSLDEYGNKAALTLGFVSRGRRERSIEYFKAEFLKSLQ